ncbi:MAG: TRAP transporter substrate-binding protein [Oscillospiraceae bacterium]
MSTRKIIAFAMAVVLCIVFFASCTSTAPESGNSSSSAASATTETPTTPAAPVKTITFKLGHNSAEDSVYNEGAKKFAELLDEYSNGAMKVDVYIQGALGSEEEMLDGLRTGTIDFAVINSANVAKYAPDWNIFALPYLFVSDDHLLAVENSEIGQALVDSTLEKAGIRVFTPFWADGFRMTMQSVREVKVPTDLKGIKIRVPDWPVLIAVMKEFGAVPTAMPFGEVYLAMSSGVVEGVETSPWALVSGKFYEVAKYVTLDGHLNTPTLLCMDPEEYDALSPENQAIVDRAASEAGVYQYEFTRQTNDANIEELRNLGCTITEVDKSEWIAAAKPVFDKFAADMDQDMLKEIQDMAD